jgi:hypothetical protein
MGSEEMRNVRRSKAGHSAARSPRRAATTVLLAGAAAAGLGHVRSASAANTVYTFTGPGGTATAPTTGDFNTSTNWLGGVAPVSGTSTSSAVELDFGGSGSTSYTGTNNIGSGHYCPSFLAR